MKTIGKIVLLLVFLNLGNMIFEQKATAQQVAVSFQMFYDQLSPYGRWIDHPNHGHVWIPSVSVGFMPYQTSGHWIYTEYGCTWASDYPWGWAPFHYGRWFPDPVYGWVWVPGDEWGPAWVVWSHSSGYYGWAPLAPGISISLALGGGWIAPHNHWMFVQDRYLCNSHLEKHYLDRSRYTTYFNNMRIINNSHIDNSRHVTYVSGPLRGEVQKSVPNHPIRTYSVQDINRPAQVINKNQMQIYRPNVVINKNESPRPANVERYNTSPPERRPGVIRNTPPIQNQRNIERPTSTPRREVPSNNRREGRSEERRSRR